MADHAQDQILAAFKAAIVAANTAAGADVYVERVDPLSATKCPAVLIEAGEEEIAPPTGSGWPRLQLRALVIKARIVVAQNAAYRAAAGNLAKEVEAAICASHASQTLGGLAHHGVHLSKSAPEKDGEGEKAVYIIEQTWHAGYRTYANAPDVPV